MSKDGLAAVLHALATDTKGRPETARLRDVFADVETALAAGVPHASVLKALHDQGFKMSMASFRSALYRIRKERTGNPPAPARTTPATPSPTPHQVADPVGASEAADQETKHEDTHADLSGLSPTAREKAMRERTAQEFIRDKPQNPLLKSLKKEPQK